MGEECKEIIAQRMISYSNNLSKIIKIKKIILLKEIIDPIDEIEFQQ